MARMPAGGGEGGPGEQRAAEREPGGEGAREVARRQRRADDDAADQGEEHPHRARLLQAVDEMHQRRQSGVGGAAEGPEAGEAEGGRPHALRLVEHAQLGERHPRHGDGAARRLRAQRGHAEGADDADQAQRRRDQ